ncbi:Protein FAM92A [Araneus ventricosus]|uniref:Protein FAM92A n=1 Tax=Araneus ventricosus TaxID=182803 RepID=A0A4Y2Q4I2_ARAVE|nr:Protein FAM92A [Araneus ventricosus]
MALDLRSSELEQAFIKERISNVEKHFSELSSKLSLYNKKLAHVRDSGDDLAKSILNFASKENLNTSLRSSLMHFADLLIAIQEYRDAQIQRIDVKVVLEFANYNPICKRIKNDLTACFEIRKKEIKKKNQLEKTRGKNSTNWQAIAERDYSQAKREATLTVTDLSKKIDNFERQKIEDIKHVFLELIKIEMVFHAKAIELYTTAYNTIKNIKVDEDLKEFQSHFRSYSSPMNYIDNSAADSNGITENPSTSRHEDLILNEQNQMTDGAVNSCNASLKSYIHSKASSRSPDSSIASPLTKQFQELTKADQTNKHSASCSSFGSSVRSKFDFGDHCL